MKISGVSFTALPCLSRSRNVRSGVDCEAKQQERELEKLFQSLMQRAFRGELVG